MPETRSTSTSTSSEAASSSSSSEDDATLSTSLLGRFDWDEIPFQIIRSHIEPVRRRPRWTAQSIGEFTSQLLEQRQLIIHQISIDNPYRLPCVLRYTACYEYFAWKARSDLLRRAQFSSDDGDLNKEMSESKLQVYRQIMLFDHVRDLNPHPCDFPSNQLGNVYLSSGVILLKYTIYTRYRYYVGRCLDSLNFPVRPAFKRIWKRASIELAKASDWLTAKKQEGSQVQECEYGNIIMHSIVHRMNQQLRVRNSTMERAIESLEKYGRHRHRSGCWDGTPATEVRTFELENMVRTGDHAALAEALCSDFVALDSLKRFEQDDLELVHLQAIICGLARFFFGIAHIQRGQEEDTGSWKPKSLFWHQQKRFRSDNAERFSEPIQWSLRVRSEKAEERFGNAWIALNKDTGKDQDLLHELLRGYVESLGIEYAAPEEKQTFVQVEEKIPR